MEDIINSIKEKAALLEAYADVLDTLNKNIRYYQHEDEDTGEIVDDTDDWSKARLAAYRETMKAVKKLAGV